MDIGVGGVLRRCGRKHVIKFLLRRFIRRMRFGRFIYRRSATRLIEPQRRTPVVHPSCRIFIAHSSSCFSMYTFLRFTNTQQRICQFRTNIGDAHKSKHYISVFLTKSLLYAVFVTNIC